MQLHCCLFIEAVVTELSVQTLVVRRTPSIITYYRYEREIMFNNHFFISLQGINFVQNVQDDYYSKVDSEIILLSVL